MLHVKKVKSGVYEVDTGEKAEKGVHPGADVMQRIQDLAGKIAGHRDQIAVLEEELFDVVIGVRDWEEKLTAMNKRAADVRSQKIQKVKAKTEAKTAAAPLGSSNTRENVRRLLLKGRKVTEICGILDLSESYVYALKKDLALKSPKPS